MECDQRKAVELAIELTRYLVEKHNIPYDNVVGHREVSNTECPKWICDNNLLEYIKSEVKRRNDEKIELIFDPSQLQTGDSVSDNNVGTGSMPNFDNREDLTNLKEVKGVMLVHMPPFHFNSNKSKEESWKKIGYNKEFHYSFDGTMKKEKEKNLIAMSMQNNNRHTYIERALYGNKAFKYTLNVGLFTPTMISDYPKYETKLIDELSIILYENKLQTKDLWREFDFNRAPSPFMYLDREQWKLLLKEVDKQLSWRYENFGDPILPEKDPNTSIEDFSKLKDDIGKKGYTNRYCMLRSQPTMTAPTIKALVEGETLTVVDVNGGYYKVKLDDFENEGWIIASSVKISDNRRYIKKAKNNNIPKPEITPTMTHKEYLAWVDLTDPKLIDDFAGECEPYDKGLKEIIEAPVKQDDRLTSLTKQETTKNDNTIHYAITEGSPGDSGHCVKPAAELNVLYKSGITKVDPIYPDLIVPPNYSPSEYNINQQNPIPLSTLEDNSLIKDQKDFDNNQLTFDYELLNDKKKVSKGKPINYLDPYPYDDKIFELEQHHPKIKIDSIESRLYERNHPGDPLPQPVAKNFALVYDAMLKQSSNIETRLVKIENVLASVLRSLGRVGSRVNINCVYYGGQDTFGKYKTIRCLCDDRIHDACSVTLDQCLSCTRYEPIIGQVYEILDDTGMNGSIFLDNMQMGYQSLDDLKNLNRVEKRNSNLTFANVNKDIEKPKSKIKEWEEQDKQAYINNLKKKITDEAELKKIVEEIKQEDYAFKMNWYEQDLDLQEPDIKPYPTEGIKSKYKKTETGNPANNGLTDIDIKDNVIDDETDQDYIKDLTDLDKLNNGEWVDTREEADTHEINEYSSEDYYFEDFNKQNNYADNAPGGIFGAEARNKIVEKAKEIVELHKAGKAGYSQGTPSGNRTVDDEKRVVGGNAYLSNIFVYDCSSLVSCCYKHAGLTSMYNKNTYAQIEQVVANKGQMWLANSEGLKNALPGDLIYTTEGKMPVSQAMMGKYIPTQHVLIYIGDNKVAHASTDERPAPDQIKIDDVSLFLTSCNFFVRPNDLIEADKKAANTGSNSISMSNGTVNINGKSYPTLATISGAVCTPYHANTFMGGGSTYSRTGQKYKDIVSNTEITVPTESAGRSQVKYCASHNLPYGTQLYFPKLKEKGLGDGIVMVVDTGGHVFDFDINMDDGQAAKFGGKQTMDAYVLKWGEDEVISPSYRKAASWYDLSTRQSLSTA